MSVCENMNKQATPNMQKYCILKRERKRAPTYMETIYYWNFTCG
jgi:hypothetical protein